MTYIVQITCSTYSINPQSGLMQMKIVQHGCIVHKGNKLIYNTQIGAICHTANDYAAHSLLNT